MYKSVYLKRGDIDGKSTKKVAQQKKITMLSAVFLLFFRRLIVRGAFFYLFFNTREHFLNLRNP